MIDQLTDTLARAATRYERSKGSTRTALSRTLAKSVAEAESQRDELVAWLNERDAWFWRNPDSPKTMQREDAWIAVLREYEAIEDEITAARVVLGGGTCR